MKILFYIGSVFLTAETKISNKYNAVAYQQAIAWVDYLFFNVPILHTWKIYPKKDDMELSFFDRRYFFDRIITTTM